MQHLKHPVHSVALVLIALLPLPATASSGQCYAIKDKDLRQQCLATTQGQKSRCYAIADKNARNQCLAQTGSQKSRCYSITDADKRKACLAMF
jgi:hypothetical protein